MRKTSKKITEHFTAKRTNYILPHNPSSQKYSDRPDKRPINAVYLEINDYLKKIIY